MRHAWLFPLALAVLAACAPTQSEERVTVEQLTEPIGYYPQQTGATWRYLPDNARLGDPAVVLRVEGPTVIDGDVWIAFHMVGLGLDVGWFRQFRPDGVYLKREVRPGTEITFDPPIRELPEQGAMRVGTTWNGSTTARVFYPQATPENQRDEIDVDYRFTVVDERTVTVAAGTFDVYVINFITRSLDADGGIREELTQETWFSPFIGDVKTENDFFLVGANFLDDASGGGADPAGD